MKDHQQALFKGRRIQMTDSIALSLESLNFYAALHDEWALCWSGGKDSTAMVTFVLWALATGKITHPPKRVIVLYADTGLEILPLGLTAQEMIRELRDRDIEVRVVRAPLDKRFLVYMLGRGVPPPNNGTLRWCTRQIKVDPMREMIASLKAESGRPWLAITGVRQGESAIRDARIVQSCSKDGAECGQGWYQTSLDGIAATLAPLLPWRVCHVWEWLRTWAVLEEYGGWSTSMLADAYGGDEAEEINARTGCVGCPLASRDMALETVCAMARWAYLAPLLELKALWAELREPRHRLRQPGGERRQDGGLAANQNRMGPLTMPARLWALDRLLDIQRRVNEAASALGRPRLELLPADEEARIRELITLDTWPRGWTGKEPVATAAIEAWSETGSVQGLLPVRFPLPEDEEHGVDETFGLEDA